MQVPTRIHHPSLLAVTPVQVKSTVASHNQERTVSDSESIKTKKRVLILSKKLDEPGGVVHVVRSLMESASADVEYLHLSIGSRSGGMLNPWNWVFPVLDVFRLALRVSNWKPAYVHINPSLNLASILRDGLLLVSLRLLGFPNRIVMFHGWEKAQAVGLRRNCLLGTFFLQSFGKAIRTVVLAQEFKDDLVNLGFDPSSIMVVPTMFDGQLFRNMPDRQPVAATRVLFLSRFVAAKGVYIVLEAVQRLVGEGCDIRLLLAGDGPEQAQMQEWVAKHGLAERVVFLGYVRGARKAEIFAESDVFAFPTTYPEGCPVSLLEALAAGLPVVCSCVGGMRDVLQDGRNGVVLEQPTVEAVAEGIRRFHADRALARSVGEANRAYAWTTFESGVIARQIAQAYGEHSHARH